MKYTEEKEEDREDVGEYLYTFHVNPKKNGWEFPGTDKRHLSADSNTLVKPMKEK